MKILKNKKAMLLWFDALLLPGIYLCRVLSEYMLSQSSQCAWTVYGGKCVTCGGTHFVNAIAKGDLIGAFHHNQFLFLCLMLTVVVWVLLHLHCLFCVRWAQKTLKHIVSIPGLILVLAIMLVFFAWRNIPVWMRLIEILAS